MEDKSGGEALILFAEREGRLLLNEENAAKVFLHPHVQDNKVMILAVVGAFRTGKSFLLNYLLLYLQSGNDSSRFDSYRHTKHRGFRWCGSTDRVTQGIWIWSEPFIQQSQDGSRTAIILMDTQGLYDHQTSVKGNTSVFAISTLLSSVQILNMNNRIQETDLQNLTFFCEYARIAKDDDKPFQKLVFLVRDWMNADDDDGEEEDFEEKSDDEEDEEEKGPELVNLHGYGTVGGHTYLQKVLQISPTQPLEMQDVRNLIQETSDSVRCFLMPHPGLKVAKAKSSVNPSDIEFKFIANMKVFASFVVDEHVPKIMQGEAVTGNMLFQLTKNYTELLDQNLFDPKSAMESTADILQMRFILKAVEEYKQTMEAELRLAGWTGVEPDIFHAKHQRITEKILSEHSQKNQFGSERTRRQFTERLVLIFQRICKNVTEANNENWSARSAAVGRASAEVSENIISWIGDHVDRIKRMFDGEEIKRFTSASASDQPMAESPLFSLSAVVVSPAAVAVAGGSQLVRGAAYLSRGETAKPQYEPVSTLLDSQDERDTDT